MADNGHDFRPADDRCKRCGRRRREVRSVEGQGLLPCTTGREPRAHPYDWQQEGDHPPRRRQRRGDSRPWDWARDA